MEQEIRTHGLKGGYRSPGPRGHRACVLPTRQLKPRQKAQVRKIREAKGVRVAIVRAKEFAQA